MKEIPKLVFLILTLILSEIALSGPVTFYVR